MCFVVLFFVGFVFVFFFKGKEKKKYSKWERKPRISTYKMKYFRPIVIFDISSIAVP